MRKTKWFRRPWIWTMAITAVGLAVGPRLIAADRTKTQPGAAVPSILNTVPANQGAVPGAATTLPGPRQTAADIRQEAHAAAVSARGGKITAGGVKAYLSPQRPPKEPYTGPPNVPNADKAAMAGGEDIATARFIGSLPFADFGTTAGFADDYDQSCVNPAPGSPDVVYSYTPPVIQRIDIILCNANYDTRIWVYINGWSPVAYTCNDDECGTPPMFRQSEIPCLPVFAGNTYYIVVDGHSGAFGNYELEVRDCSCAPEIFTCDAGDIQEGEPCVESMTDTFNGGCNSSPEIYSPIIPGEMVCGTAWATNAVNGGWRDTDWYRYVLPSPDSLTWCVRAAFPFQLAILDLTGGCYTLLANDYGPACGIMCLGLRLPAGTYAFFVSPGVYDGLPCAGGPWRYEAQLQGCSCGGGDIAEGEGCFEGVDAYDGGCNFFPENFVDMHPGERYCGTVWADGDLRDTDWYRYVLQEADSVTFCVNGNFPVEAILWNITAGCDARVVLFDYSSIPSCNTLYIGARLPVGRYAFEVFPQDFAGLPCPGPPYHYETCAIPNCLCPCHADPECDGNTDVLDVTHTVNRAFRGFGPMNDPFCPWERTDVNCDGHTDVLDVTRVVNVAFRGLTPASQFCDPCP